MKEITGEIIRKKECIFRSREKRIQYNYRNRETQFRRTLKDHLILSPSFNFTVLPQASADFKEGDRPVTWFIKQVFH